MSKTNSDSIKQLAADLYGSANTSAKNYAADYNALSTENKKQQRQAAENYNAAINSLKKENAAAYEKIQDKALLQSRSQLNAPQERVVNNGEGIYGTADKNLTGTAQILHDNALGTAFNDINAEKKNRNDELSLAQNLADLRRKQNTAQALADITGQQVAAQRIENQAAAADRLKASQYLAAALENYNVQNQGEIAFAEQQRQNAFVNQLARDEFAELQQQNTFENDLANREFIEFQKQNKFNNAMARNEFFELQRQNAFDNGLANDEFAELQKQNSYQNAINEINTFGKVLTKASAEALGVPIGTSAAYAKVAQIEAARNAAGSGGGGGNDPSNVDPYEGIDYDEAFLTDVGYGYDTTSAYMYQLSRAEANGASVEEKARLNQAVVDTVLSSGTESVQDYNKKTHEGNLKVIEDIRNKRASEKAANEAATIISSRLGYAGGQS